MNELEQFLSGIPSVEDLQQEPAPTEPEKEPEGTEPGEPPKQEDGFEPRNRRERRLQSRLQAERESNIEMAARLAAITDSQMTRKEESDALKALERLWGNETPEAREATAILRDALTSIREEAREQALQAFNAEKQKEQQAVQEAEAALDSMVDDIEDEFNVDLSDDKTRTGFFKLLERMSPKDRDGNIIEYADHYAVWEEYQERTKKPTNPAAKTLAARSMTAGAGEAPTTVAQDTQVQWLRENGII